MKLRIPMLPWPLGFNTLRSQEVPLPYLQFEDGRNVANRCSSKDGPTNTNGESMTATLGVQLRCRGILEVAQHDRE
jgi:hypothetical protein